MKRFGNIYQSIFTTDNLTLALINSAKQKRHRACVQYCFDNRNQVIAQIQKERKVSGLYKEKHIVDKASGKERNIFEPKFMPDQIVHHAIIQKCNKYFEKGMYRYCCGSVKHKGTLFASKHLRKVIRTDKKHTKYFVKLDIRKYYENVNHEILKEKFTHLFKDCELLQLLNNIVDSVPKGLPIGNYTSQIFANFFLKDLDHYIKETLKVSHYIRYMDDMLILGSNKRELEKDINLIKKYLAGLKLETHGNEKVEILAYRDNDDHIVGNFIDFCGYKHYRTYTTIRKRTWRRLRRLLIRLIRGYKLTIEKARSLMSYLGYYIHSNNYHMQIKYMEYINLKKVRYVISKGGN